MTKVTSRGDDEFDEVVSGPVALADGERAVIEPVVVESTGSRLDDWWSRMLSTPARRRAWEWGGPAAVTALAAGLRLWNLGHPHELVFDETFYVKDAWTLLGLGYEAQWGMDPDTAFEAGQVDGYTDRPAYVVHPPLGKWVIALGLAAFGAESSVGWRIGTAVVGILLVLLVMLVAKRLFRSTLLAVIAGGLIAIDGNAIVMSRVAILDGILALFLLLGFGAVLLDREHSRTRLALWLAQREAAGRSTDWGPALWWRPWLIAAGVAFGLAAAVKWNALYYLAAFALYTLVVDALARRRAGIGFWASGTALKQAPVSFLLTVPVAVIAYLATWTGWFVTDGGYNRDWAEQPGNAWTGPLAWVPLPLQSLWQFEIGVYNYHVGENNPHGWQAHPLTWLLLVRPTMMYYRGTDFGVDGCGSTRCAEVIHDLANPIVWWASVVALLYLVYRLIRYREWQVGIIVLGFAAGYLPWLMYLNRTVFQFYTIAFQPYLILALTFALGVILGKPSDPTWRRVGGIRLVAVFLILVVCVSAFFYPLWTAMQVPAEFVQLHYWLPTWR